MCFDDFCDLSCVLLFLMLMFVSVAIFAVLCFVIFWYGFSFSVSGNNLSGLILDSLGNLNSLQRLDLSSAFR